MPNSLVDPTDVIDAGFLVSDLTDATGTHTLIVDYSGSFAGREVWSVFFYMNGVPGERDYNSVLRYNAGTGSAPELGSVEFAVSSFQRLVFRGGNQHDVVYGAVGGDVFRGGAGDDVFVGRGGRERLFGGDGNDRLELAGQNAADLVRGGNGIDTVLNVGANDTVYGGSGTDSVWVNLHNLTQGLSLVLDDFATQGNLHGIEYVGLQLTDQDDSLQVSHRYLMNSSYDAPASYELGEGDDWLTVDFRQDATELLHWDGDVLTTYAVLPDGTVNPELGKEVYFQGYEHLILSGTDNADRIYGGGDATFYGEGGDDILQGRTYSLEDSLVLYGGDGDDLLTLSATEFADGVGAPAARGAEAVGGFGDDTIRGGAGADLLVGDTGNDRLSGGDGADTLRGGAGADTLLGERANDELHGSFGNDELRGGDSRDRLYGGGGNDRLFGEGSTDALYGGMGDDTLSGGYNNDTLCGRDGRDTFFFEGLRGTGSDVIMDYEAGDVLHFAGGLTAADITAAVSGQDVRLSWSTGTVLVQFAAGMHIDMTFGL